MTSRGSHGQPAHRHPHVHVQVQVLHHAGGFPVDRPLVQQPSLHLLLSEKDVVGHRKIGRQRELLINALDTVSLGAHRRVNVRLFPIDQDGPAVLPVSAGQDLDQCGLSRAVRPHQRVDLTLPQAKLNIIKHTDPGKTFADMLHLNRVCHKIPPIHQREIPRAARSPERARPPAGNSILPSSKRRRLHLFQEFPLRQIKVEGEYAAGPRPFPVRS